MKTSENGLQFVKSWEGCKLEPYDDGAGYKTVGVGHKLLDGEPVEPITDKQAVTYLINDIVVAENAVNDLVDEDLSQNEFDALVSFTFNLGRTSLANSHALTYLNNGNHAACADALLNWNHIDGKVSEGLTRRRAAERILFLTAVYGMNE
jgi:lysozyme